MILATPFSEEKPWSFSTAAVRPSAPSPVARSSDVSILPHRLNPDEQSGFGETDVLERVPRDAGIGNDVVGATRVVHPDPLGLVFP